MDIFANELRGDPGSNWTRCPARPQPVQSGRNVLRRQT
jgi:hypothetical protein